MVRLATFDSRQERRHKHYNLVHSGALVVLMLGVLGLCAWLLAGQIGVVWGVSMALFLMVAAKRLSPQIMLALYSARKIPFGSIPRAHEITHELAQRAKLNSVPNLYYIPSSSPIAFSMGSPSESYIAVSDGLLRLLNSREFSAVMAHEVCHIKNRDILVMGMADVVARITHFVGVAGLALLFLSVPAWLSEYGYVPWVPGLIMFLAPMASNLMQLALSRTREFDADLGAASLTHDPGGLVSALQKIEGKNNGFWRRVILGDRGQSIPSILRTHPPSNERIDRLLDLYKVERFEPMPSAPLLVPSSFVRPQIRPRRRFGGVRW